MLSIVRLRRRLPLVVFVLLLVLFVIALGVACLCAVDHPSQAAERAGVAAAHVPAVIVLWSFVVLLLAPRFVAPRFVAVLSRDRASPVTLQRLLF